MDVRSTHTLPLSRLAATDKEAEASTLHLRYRRTMTFDVFIIYTWANPKWSTRNKLPKGPTGLLG